MALESVTTVDVAPDEGAPKPDQTPEPSPAPAPEPGAPAPMPEPAPGRPAGLPEEFASVEQMASVLAELRGGEPAPAPAPEPTPAPDNTEVDATGVQTLVEGAGLDFGELSEAWQADGSLADAHYAAFQEKLGLSRSVIDDFLLGQQARVAGHTASIVDAVGGQELFSAAAEWAGQNLSEAEQGAYNEAVESGNFERAKLAAQGLVLNYQKASGSEPNYAQGDGPAAQSATGFESKAQVTAAMSDERYRKDPAYRAEVAKRLASTPDDIL